VGSECEEIIRLALSRVCSAEAQREYVVEGKPEEYQTKHERSLALDVCEELADAVAYLAPLAEINEDYAVAVTHIARAYNLVETIGWRREHGQ
jgi:hypothetical protein